MLPVEGSWTSFEQCATMVALVEEDVVYVKNTGLPAQALGGLGVIICIYMYVLGGLGVVLCGAPCMSVRMLLGVYRDTAACPASESVLWNLFQSTLHTHTHTRYHPPYIHMYTHTYIPNQRSVRLALVCRGRRA